jgi:hypothetical protein
VSARQHLLLLPAFLGDVHNLVLEDEQIGRAFAGQSNHVLVEIFDPSVDGLAVHEFDRYRLLLLSNGLEKRCLLIRVLRRGRPAALLVVIALLLALKRHAGIVHNVVSLTAGRRRH